MFTKEPSATKNVSVPTGQPQGFSPLVLGRTAMVSYEWDDGLEDSSWAGFSRWEELYRGMKTACQLYACRVGKVSRRSAIPLTGD
jgi:hypothetical protein